VKFFCIGDEDTVRGFRLAGVEGQAVTTSAEAAAALEAAVARADVGIVIVTDLVAADIRPQVDAVRVDLDRPLIVEIPGPEGPMPGRKTLRQFVQEAVGIRIGQEEGA
jgi:V/A-type H+-transporting ATPase subunit F